MAGARQVIIFEPLPDNIAQLRRFLNLNPTLPLQLEELAVTVIGCSVPRTSVAMDVGETLNVQPPDWVTGIDVPARITVPDCEGPFRSAAAVIRIDPLPVPPVALKVIHEGAEAVHAQPIPLVTTLAIVLPPMFGNTIEEFDTVNVQFVEEATVTGITCPATVMLPDSIALLMFVDAIAFVEPDPDPPGGDKNSLGRVEEAVHAQPALLAVTRMPSGPPCDGNAKVVGETV